MKKRILSIATLALVLGVVTANNIKDDNRLEVRDVLLEDVNKIGNKVHKNAANEVAEYKISDVKAQVSDVYQDTNNGNRIDIRFVAGIDTYTYTNAKFNVTIKNGDDILKTIEKEVNYAYEKIEAKKDILTAAEAFGTDYNYMIAYTIQNVPESAWGYNFEVTASVSTDGIAYNSSSVVTKNIEVIKAADEVESPYMYIFGDVFENGWSVATKIPMVSEDTYELTADFNVGTFIVCEVNEISTTGSKLKNENNKNFEISVAGNYTLKITRLDMSTDTSWSLTTEVNEVSLATAYYQLTPNFEIVEEEVKIDVLYLNGDFVGGWNTYTQLTKVSESLYEIEINLAASGGVITAQKSRGDSDLVFKLPNGGNISVDTAGKYKVSVSLVAQDDTWTEITDCKNNYTDSIYIKIEAVVEERTNVALTAVGAEASSAKKVATNVYDGELGDTKRWESDSSDPQWIKVDLGAEYNISGIEIQWYGRACAKDYVVYYTNDATLYDGFSVVSNDDSTVNIEETFNGWNNIVTVSEGATEQNRADSHEFEEVTARYIIILGTSRNYGYGYSINELYIYGK